VHEPVPQKTSQQIIQKGSFSYAYFTIDALKSGLSSAF
jgi:hypothetical protein